MSTTKRYDKRIERIIEIAQNEKRSLRALLPQKEIRIDTRVHEKNRAIGRILDKLSNNRYEWYGYNLSEKGDPTLIVDTLLQDDQIVTGVDVDFKPIAAKKTFEALYQRNEEEGRLDTDKELIPTGIVHRHGFCTDKPFRSGADVLNLSRYVRWRSQDTEILSDQSLHFDHFTNFTVSQDNGSLVFKGRTPDDISLTYTLGSHEDDEVFLKNLGINSSDLEPIGGLSGLLLAHFSRDIDVSASQRQYVSTASSIIYNQNGRKLFGEIIVRAQGAVTHSHEEAFIVPVKFVSSHKSPKHNFEALKREVDEKITWQGKHDPEIMDGSQNQSPLLPSTVNEVYHRTVSKKGNPSDNELASACMHAGLFYLSQAFDESACYSDYLSSLFNSMARSKKEHLSRNVRRIGILEKDQPDEHGKVRITKIEPYKHYHLTDSLLYSLQRDTQGHVREFYEHFRGEIAPMNSTLETYVQAVLEEDGI